MVTWHKTVSSPYLTGEAIHRATAAVLLLLMLLLLLLLLRNAAAAALAAAASAAAVLCSHRVCALMMRDREEREREEGCVDVVLFLH